MVRSCISILGSLWLIKDSSLLSRREWARFKSGLDFYPGLFISKTPSKAIIKPIRSKKMWDIYSTGIATIVRRRVYSTHPGRHQTIKQISDIMRRDVFTRTNLAIQTNFFSIGKIGRASFFFFTLKTRKRTTVSTFAYELLNKLQCSDFAHVWRKKTNAIGNFSGILGLMGGH